MAAGRTTVLGSGYSSAYIDALVWGGTVWDPKAGPVTYYFGERPDFKAASTVHGSSPYLARATDAEPWTAEEIGAFKGAISLYAQVCGLTFAPAASAADADIVWWKTDIRDGSLGAAEPPGDSQTWGYFNPSVAESWGNFRAGGDGRNTIIHELGHMTGLAHPHDGGTRDDATLFPGVSSEHDTGSYGLNQGIWTVMSYNSGWDRRDHDLTYGAQGGLGAFDIAALQSLYGPNPNTAKGSDVYALPTANAPGAGWSCIWDAGGTDTISGLRSSKSVTIDLRPATLRPNDPQAGGFVSSQDDVAGGFTIAKDVTIENAVGGSGDDRIWGNAVANKLRGNAGDDVLRGLGGNDRLVGRAGNDILVGGQGEDVFVFDTQPNGRTNLDRIVDFNVEDDRIGLDRTVFKSLRPGALGHEAFWTGPKAHDRNDRIVYDSKKGVLSYDADGSGAGKAVAIATLSKDLKMTAADFLVI